MIVLLLFATSNTATIELCSLSNLIDTLQLADAPFSKVVEYSAVEVTKACIQGVPGEMCETSGECSLC